MSTRQNHSLIFIIFVFIFLLASCSPQKIKNEGSVWEGTIETIDGVIIVKNPKEPMYGEDALFLEEELTIGEAKGREEYMFQSLYSLAVNDNGDIFALDTIAKHVKVYNREGLYLRTIGRPGQGPGEFSFPMSLILTARDELVVGFMNNISYFSSEGEYIKSIPIISTARFLSIDIDTAGNIFGISIGIEQMGFLLKKYDPELNELLLFGFSPSSSEESNRTGKRNAFFTPLRWDIINGDQVVTGYPEEGYVVKILDTSGNLIRRIEREYTPIETTQKDFEERIADRPPKLKKDLYAPKHFPPYRNLIADDEGRIWVRTSEKAPDGKSHIYDVFDPEGRFILKVALKATPRVMKNNQMYTIEEDDEGFHVIKRYKVSWNY